MLIREWCCWCQHGVCSHAWHLRGCRPFPIALKHCKGASAQQSAQQSSSLVLTCVKYRQPSPVPASSGASLNFSGLKNPSMYATFSPASVCSPALPRYLTLQAAPAAASACIPAALPWRHRHTCRLTSSCNQQAWQCPTAAAAAFAPPSLSHCPDLQAHGRSLTAATSRPSRVSSAQGSGPVVGSAGLEGQARADSQTSSARLGLGLGTQAQRPVEHCCN